MAKGVEASADKVVRDIRRRTRSNPLHTHSASSSATTSSWPDGGAPEAGEREGPTGLSAAGLGDRYLGGRGKNALVRFAYST